MNEICRCFLTDGWFGSVFALNRIDPSIYWWSFSQLVLWFDWEIYCERVYCFVLSIFTWLKVIFIEMMNIHYIVGSDLMEYYFDMDSISFETSQYWKIRLSCADKFMFAAPYSLTNVGKWSLVCQFPCMMVRMEALHLETFCLLSSKFLLKWCSLYVSTSTYVKSLEIPL